MKKRKREEEMLRTEEVEERKQLKGNDEETVEGKGKGKEGEGKQGRKIFK